MTVPVIVDRTFPTLVSFTATPSPAPLGPVQFFVNASEVLLAPPAVNVGGVPASFVSQTGTSYTFQFNVTTVTPNGANPVSITMTDRANHVTNTQASFNVNYTLDTTPPVTTLTVNGPQFAGGGLTYLSPASTLALSATDAGAGVQRIEYRLDGGSFQTYSVPFALTEGVRTVDFRAVDNQNNTENTQSQTFHVDGTVPLTMAALQGGTALTPTSYVGNAAARFVLTGQDPLNNGVTSGLASTSYRLDGGALQPYTASLALTPGAHTLQFQSQDNVQNLETLKSVQVTIDAAGPTFSGLSPDGGAFATGQTIIVAFTAADNFDSNPSVVAFLTDLEEGTTVAVTNGQSVAAASLDDGQWRLTVRATDWVGNTSELSAAPFTVAHDNQPPRTTLSVGTPLFGANPTYVTPATLFTFAAVDDGVVVGDGAGQGVAQTLYSIDGGPEVVYAGPFSVTAEGAHVVSFRSVDVLGAPENPQTLSIAVDDTAPTVSLVAGQHTHTANGQLFASPLTSFRLAAQDPLINGVAVGVAAAQYAVDGSPFNFFTANFFLTAGTRVLGFRAMDRLGQTSPTGSQTVRVDGTAPVSGLSIGSPQVLVGGQAVVGPTTPLTLTAQDPGTEASGVRAVFHTLDEGSYETYTAPFFLTGNGVRTVNFFAEDFVDNSEVPQMINVGVDTTAPQTIPAVANAVLINGDYVGGLSAQISFTAQDPQNGGLAAGLQAIRYGVDGDAFQTYASPFSLPPGWHTVLYQSADAVGNIEPLRSFNLVVDGAPPALSDLSPDGGRFFSGQSVAVAFDVTDDIDPAPSVQAFLTDMEEGTQVPVTNGQSLAAASLDDGFWRLSVNATDAAGNTANATVAPFEIVHDNQPPRTTVSVGTPKFSANPTYVTPATLFTLNAVDDGTTPGDGAGQGVAQTLYSLDGGPAQVYTAPFAVAAEGAHTLSFHSVDTLGAAETPKSLSIAVDATVPTAAIAANQHTHTAGGQLFASPLTSFSLSAQDPVSNGVASGLAGSEYAVDGGVFTAYATPFVLSAGLKDVTFRARDNLGQLSVTGAQAVRVDGSAPVSTLTIGNPQIMVNGQAVVGPATPLSLTAQDAGADQAGVRGIFYAVDNAGVQPYAAPFTLTGAGLHTLSHFAEDFVDNVEVAQMTNIALDAAAPLTTVAVANAASVSGGYVGGSDARVSFTAQDAPAGGVAAGLLLTRYQVDGGAFQNYAAPFSLAPGRHSVAYQSQDNVGNTEALRSFDVTVDVLPPVISGLAPNGGHFTSGQTLTVDFHVADNLDPAPAVQAALVHEGGATVAVTAGQVVAVSALAEGAWTLTVRASDWASNDAVLSAAAFAVTHDNFPPRTTLAVGAPQFGDNPVQVGPATSFTLSAVDDGAAAGDSAGQGVAQTLYSLDGAPALVYAAPFPVPAEGTHVLRFHSVDVLGGTETEQTFSFSVDATPPLTAASLQGGTLVSPNAFIGNAAARLALTGQDPVSNGVAAGLASTSYRVDGDAFQTYDAPLVLAPGVHTVDFRGLDNVQNLEAVKSVHVTIDAAGPVISGLAPAGGAYAGGQSIAIAFTVVDAVDPAPSVVAFMTDLEKGTTVSVANSQSLRASSLDEGRWRLTVRAVDAVGNVSETSAAPFAVTHDNRPPRTTIIVGTRAFGTNPTFVTPATLFSLTAVDDGGTVGDEAGQGVARTLYSIDGGAEIDYTVPFGVSSEGDHAVAFHSVDTLGAVEAVQSLEITVDGTKPETALSVGAPSLPASGRTLVTSQTPLTLTAIDRPAGAASGVKKIVYRFDGGPETVYAGPLTLAGADGNKTLAFHAADNLGNDEPVHTAALLLDNTPPVTAFSFTGGDHEPIFTGTGTYVITGDTRMVLTADDGGAGVKKIFYAIDGGAETAYAEPFGFAPGPHTVVFRAEDALGNREALQTVRVSSDNRPPNAALIVGAPKLMAGHILYVSTRTSISFAIEGNPSPAASVKVQYRLDGGAFETYTAPFTLPEGVRLLEYRSGNAAANGDLKAQTFHVDGSAPVTKLVIQGPQFVRDDVTVVGEGALFSLPAADPSVNGTSVGVDGVFYRLNGGAFARLTSGLPPLSEGTHTLDFYGLDKLGHQEPIQTVKLMMDRTAPATAVTVGDPKIVQAGKPLLIGPQTPLKLNATDPVVNGASAGVGKIYYRVAEESTSFSVYNGAALFLGGAAGVKTLMYYSEDNVGRAEEIKQAVFEVDGAAPTLTLLSPAVDTKGLGHVFTPGLLPVLGAAGDTHFAFYSVSVASAAGRISFSAGPFTLVKQSTVPTGGALALWNTAKLSGWWTVRVLVQDTLGNKSETKTNVFLGAPELAVSLGKEKNDSRLKDIRGIATDGQGYIYLGEAGHVRKMSPAGATLDYLGNDGSIGTPTGVAVDAQGYVYVADRSRHVLLKLSPKGELVFRVGEKYKSGAAPGRFNDPTGVALDPQGNVWVADRKNGRLQKFSADGRFLSVLDLSKLASMDDDHDDEFPDGDEEHCERFHFKPRPRGLAIGADGTLYVTDDLHSRLLVITGEGKLKDLVGQRGKHPGFFRAPKGVAVTAQGHVYVADENNERVQRFDPDFNAVLVFGSDKTNKKSPLYMERPNGLALDPAGRLLVTDYSEDTVRAYDAPGSAVLSAPLAAAASAAFGGPALFLGPDPTFKMGESYSFPNPARGGENPTLHVEMGVADRVDIRIYDIAGALVHETALTQPPAVIDDGQGPQYAYEHAIDAANLASGVYICVAEGAKGAGERIRAISKFAVIK